MLIKVNNILQSQAPDEGNAAGGAATDGGESQVTSAGGEQTTKASEGGDGAGADSSTSDDTSDGFVEDFDFDQFLTFDPFKDNGEVQGTKSGKTAETKAEGDNASGTTSTTASTGTQQTGQGQQTPATPAEKQPGQVAKESPEMALLRQQNQQLLQALNQIQQQVVTQPAGTQAQTSTPAQTPEDKQKQWHESVAKSLPAYQMRIPDEILQKMGSDDPNVIRAGLAEFAQGVAQVTHYNVAMQMEQRLEALEQKLLEKSVSTFKQQTQAEQEAEKARTAIQKDFYGTFPELDKPELKLFIQTQAKLLAEQYGVNSWNESFRNALGEHVKRILGIGTQGPQPDAQQNQGKGQERKPGVRYSAGSGQGRVQSSPEGLVDDIASTLLG